MKRSPIRTLALLVTLSTIAFTFPSDAQAGGCGAGRSFGGYGRSIGFGGSLYNNFARPSYSGSSYAHQRYSQPIQPHTVRVSPPIQSGAVAGPAFGSGQVGSVGAAPSAAPSQFQQPIQQQGFNGQAINRPAIQQPAAVQTGVGNQGAQQSSTLTAQPPRANAAASNGNTTANLQQSALQLLAGGSNNTAPKTATSASANIPQFQTAPSPAPQNTNAGTWVASLPGNASVTLDLGTDGAFRWTAVSQGKTSSFQGNYTVNNGSLSLVRSNDGGKLTGSMSASGSSSFEFKVAGAQNGLNFQRR